MEREIEGVVESEFEKEEFAGEEAEVIIDGEDAMSKKGLENDGEGEKEANGEEDVVHTELKPGDDPSKGRETPGEK